MAASTSFRISDATRARLASRAAREGMTATALLGQLIIEGIDQLDYPGIIFRGPAHDRRAALAAGPDVWEIVARLQELDGSEEQRISLLSAESDLHPRLIRIALDYAADHADEVRARIDRNRAMAERSRRTSEQREALAGVSAFLIDEMFPTAAAAFLRETYGHDAVHVAEIGLRAAEDAHVAAVARGEGRAVVTENVVDFAAERDVVLVFVLKKNLPAGGGQAAALAKVLDRWAQDHPDPYLGPHWPST